MKNIWKLLMVAMMAIAMVGCPQPQGNNETEETATTTTTTIAVWSNDDVKPTGVYTYSGKVKEISNEWGGSSAKPAFSVLFLDETAKNAIKGGTVTDFKELPVGSPTYQIQSKGNASFFSLRDGTWKMDYGCMAVKIDGENYTLYLDNTKIAKSDLKGIGKDFGAEGETLLSTEDEVNFTGYFPVVLALGKKDNTSDATYCGSCWNAAMYKMTAGGSFPASLQTPPELVKFGIKFTGTSHIDSADATLKGNKTIEWTVTGVEWFKGEVVPFNFFADNAGNTNEVAMADAMLTATLAAGEYDWEEAQKPEGSTYKINKKCNIGILSDKWLGFNALTDEFKIDANYAPSSWKTSTRPAAGDTSSSAAGAGDNGSSAAGAGDNGSSGAAPAPSVTYTIKSGIIAKDTTNDHGEAIQAAVRAADASWDAFSYSHPTWIDDFSIGVLWTAIGAEATSDTVLYKTIEFLDGTTDTAKILAVEDLTCDLKKTPRVGYESWGANIQIDWQMVELKDAIADVTEDVKGARITITATAPTYGVACTAKSGKTFSEDMTQPADLKKSVVFGDIAKIYTKIIER